MERTNGSCPAGDFLDGLAPRERTKLDLIFQLLGDGHGIRSRTQFRKLRDTDGLFEVKSGQIRMPCFYAGGDLILAFGVRKKSDRLPKKDIRRAHHMKAEFQHQEDKS